MVSASQLLAEAGRLPYLVMAALPRVGRLWSDAARLRSCLGASGEVHWLLARGELGPWALSRIELVRPSQDCVSGWARPSQGLLGLIDL